MRSRFYAFTATERGRKEEPPSQKAAPPSAAQKHFLERELLHRHQVRVTRAMLLVLLLALWELASRFSWIDSFIFSSPSMIFDHFCAMAQDGSLFLHTGVTLMETLISFFFVTFLSLAAALLLWSNRTLAQILEPYLVMLNSLPKSAMAPLLIVWLGNNIRTIIVAAVSVALFGSILTLHTGFSQTDPDKIKLIYSLGGTKKDVLSKVLLPSSIPLMVSSMKVPGRRNHRGILIQQGRPGVSDHVWLPNLPDDLGSHFHRGAVRHFRPAVPAGGGGGKMDPIIPCFSFQFLLP